MNVQIQYLYALVFGLFGILFVAVTLFLASLIRPKNYTGRKLTTYECGEIPVGEPWSQFNIRFYVYALSFVIFDIETIFLIPWAVVFKKLGLAGFVEMFVFLAILIVGFVYAWRKGALRWA